MGILQLVSLSVLLKKEYHTQILSVFNYFKNVLYSILSQIEPKVQTTELRLQNFNIDLLYIVR